MRDRAPKRVVESQKRPSDGAPQNQEGREVPQLGLPASLSNKKKRREDIELKEPGGGKRGSVNGGLR